MIEQKGINKITTAFFYLVVIYHLLPFSPIALYYSSHHPSANIKTQEAELLSGKIILKTAFPFAAKDKNRFDFDCNVYLPSAFNEFIVPYRKISFPVLIINYFNTPLLNCSGRGPPSFFS